MSREKKVKKPKGKLGKLEKREARAGYLFVLPWVIGVLLFMLYPLCQSFYYMWFNIRITPLGTKFTYVGTGNFTQIWMENPEFPQQIVTYLWQTIVEVPIIVVFALMIAIMLNGNIRCKGFFRLIFFLPVIIVSGPVMNMLVGEGAATIPAMNVQSIVAALESFLRDTPEEAALCCATYLVENMWYGDGENEPYTTDFALTALGRLYVLSMQYLMETYNDSTSLLSALLLHTFSPEEWLYQFWGVVGGIAFAKEGFTLDSVYYDEHPIEKQCMTALLRSPKRLHVATLFDYVNPVDNERCDADHSALYDFLAEGKADDRLHIEPAGATREDLLAACTETAHWEVEGGTDTTILHITPEHGQELRLVYCFGEN